MQYLSFIPAELNEILSQQGLSWPQHLPMAASGGENRSLEEICAEHGVDSSEINLHLILRVLVRGQELLNTKQIKLGEGKEGWKAYGLASETPWIAAFKPDGAMIDLTWFEDKNSLIRWLASDL